MLPSVPLGGEAVTGEEGQANSHCDKNPTEMRQVRTGLLLGSGKHTILLLLRLLTVHVSSV